jgi:hypothetical protein
MRAPKPTAIKPMKNDAVRNPHCVDCGIDTDAINESYMIHDEVWRAANPAEAGMLCVGCCEKRLGRTLRRDDFRPYALSAFDAGMPASERLKSRISEYRRRRFPSPRYARLADIWFVSADKHATQSRSCLTVLSVWAALRPFFCAAPQPTIQVCTFLRGVNDGRDSVPLVA